MEHDYASSGNYEATLYLTLDDGSIIQSKGNFWVGSGTRYIPGHTIAGEETWFGGGTYVIEGNINVAEGGILTIEPSVQVLIESGSSLSVNGALLATGSTFTWADGQTEWEGIIFGEGSSGSKLDGCVIKHAFGRYGATIAIENASPTISGCTIKDGISIYGIFIRQGSPVISGNTILDLDGIGFGSWGISVDEGTPTIKGNTISGLSGAGISVSGSSSPTVTGNTLANNGGGVSLGFGTNNPVLKDNTYSGNTEGNLVAGGSISNHVTWDATLDPLTFGYLEIAESGSLTVQPDTVLTGSSVSSLSVNGALLATGATFTSADGQTEWGGITFWEGSSGSKLDGCVIKHAFGRYGATIAIENASPTISGCTIKDGISIYGIFIRQGSPVISGNTILDLDGIGFGSWGISVDEGTPTIKGNTISGLSRAGISVSGSSSPTVTGNTLGNNGYGITSTSAVEYIISDCTISNNTSYGIYHNSATPIIAKNNNWGHISGPLDPSDDRATGGLYNPVGQGDKVSDGVLYYPWTGTTIGATATPAGLSGSPANGLIDLTWSASTQADLGGYKIYYRTSTGTYGNPILVGKINSYQLTGLTNDITYCISISSMNTVGAESAKTTEICVKVGVTTPTVTTTAAYDIMATTAKSGGHISSDGGASVTGRGVCWSTAPNPTTANNKSTDGTGTGAFTSSITGLTTGTPYYVRAYATNSEGTAYGNEVSFTPNATAPTVTTTAVSAITQTTATSGGNVTADGGAEVTARGVCWSTTANPTIASSKTTNGSGTGSFSSSLTGLAPGTPYHVRAYATNSGGTGYGNDVTFTTSASSILYVSSDGQCGDLEPCHSTIQAALDAAEAGAIIKAAAGRYREAPDWRKTGIVTIIGGWNDAFSGRTGTTEIYAPKATGGGTLKVQPNIKAIPPQ